MNDILQFVSNQSFAIAVVTLLVGIGGIFREQLRITDQNVLKRMGLLEESLKEKVNTKLQALLNVSFKHRSSLRGSPNQSPDLIAEYSSEFLRVFHLIGELAAIRKSVRTANKSFIVTALIGLTSLCAIKIQSDWSLSISTICGICIVFQLYCIMSLSKFDDKIDEYERTT